MFWKIPQTLWNIQGVIQDALLRVFQSLQQYLPGYAFSGARTSTGFPDGATPIIQAGSFVGTTDTSAVLSVPYPTPFPNGVITVLAGNGDRTAAPDMVPDVFEDTSLTAFGFCATKPQVNSAYVSTPVRVNWMAIGW